MRDIKYANRTYGTYVSKNSVRTAYAYDSDFQSADDTRSHARAFRSSVDNHKWVPTVYDVARVQQQAQRVWNFNTTMVT